jgi:Glycine zipper
MRQRTMIVTAAVAAMLGSGAAHAQKPIVYPAKGQSAQQQQRDDGDCYVWAKNNTGIDPAVVASAPPPASGSTVGGGERGRGAARGAAGGAAIGAIAGDAGKGAAIGAVAGTMGGGRQARQNQAAKQQAAASGQQQQIQTFYRAYAACMEGRGYTIK